MIDHVGFWVSDYERAKAFYQQALAPLGMSLVMELDAAQTGGYQGCGFGPGSKPIFWIGPGEPVARAVHVAFTAPDRSTVDAFYAAAMAAGGVDNGKPGIRAHYHPNYYGAFVKDADGNNIEAVCHHDSV